MLPSTPEGVLLQGGDARREPPIVLARRAGTPYRNGHLLRFSSRIRSSLPLAAAGSWHFRGDVRALALGHAGLLRGSGGGAAGGRPGHRRLGGAMIGRAALRHKRFQQAGAVSCRTVRTRGRAAHRPDPLPSPPRGPGQMSARRRPSPLPSSCRTWSTALTTPPNGKLGWASATSVCSRRSASPAPLLCSVHSVPSSRCCTD